MALIKCPHCGKQVSDTQEKCVHCGKNIKPSAEEKTDKTESVRFSSLSAGEQNALKSEFYSRNDGYAGIDDAIKNYHKKARITQVLSYVLSASWFLTILISTLTLRNRGEETGTEPVWFVALVIFALLFISSVVMYILSYKYAFREGRNIRNQMIRDKKFCKWLKEEKNIDYSVVFTSKRKKDREFYENIDADKSEIAR